MLRNSFRLAVLAALLLVPLRAELEFTGILVTSQKTSFALTDTDTGKTIWSSVGQEIDGYQISGYDRSADVLMLTKDGTSRRLPLKNSGKVKNERLELSGEFKTAAGDKTEVQRVTLTFGQETVFPLANGMMCHITPRNPPRKDAHDGNISFLVQFDKPGDDGWITRTAVIARPGQPFSMNVEGRVAFSFTPKNN